jgi:hypothetical protein
MLSFSLCVSLVGYVIHMVCSVTSVLQTAFACSNAYTKASTELTVSVASGTIFYFMRLLN